MNLVDGGVPDAGTEAGPDDGTEAGQLRGTNVQVHSSEITYSVGRLVGYLGAADCLRRPSFLCACRAGDLPCDRSHYTYSRGRFYSPAAVVRIRHSRPSAFGGLSLLATYFRTLLQRLPASLQFDDRSLRDHVLISYRPPGLGRESAVLVK